MEKLVRVIKLRPGETVLIVAEERPTPCPCGHACVVPESKEGFPLPKGILIHMDGAA